MNSDVYTPIQVNIVANFVAAGHIIRPKMLDPSPVNWKIRLTKISGETLKDCRPANT